MLTLDEPPLMVIEPTVNCEVKFDAPEIVTLAAGA
jgi:hypothetical protein